MKTVLIVLAVACLSGCATFSYRGNGIAAKPSHTNFTALDKEYVKLRDAELNILLSAWRDKSPGYTYGHGFDCDDYALSFKLFCVIRYAGNLKDSQSPAVWFWCYPGHAINRVETESGTKWIEPQLGYEIEYKPIFEILIFGF